MKQGDIAPIDIAKPGEPFAYRSKVRLFFRGATRMPKIGNGRNPGLLCARNERPCRGTAGQPYERAPPHSITSSARASSDGGTARPSAFAVLRLTTSSNL